MGPQTGVAGRRRHPPPLRRAADRGRDARTRQGKPLVDPLFEPAPAIRSRRRADSRTPVTEIQWSADDALPFPVCISSTFLDATGEAQIADRRQRRARQRRARRPRPDDARGSAAAPCPQPTLVRAASTARPLQPVGRRCRSRCATGRASRQPADPGRAAAAGRQPGDAERRSAARRRLRQPDRRERLHLAMVAGRRARRRWPQYFGIVATPNATNPATSISRSSSIRPAGPPDDRRRSRSSSSPNLTLTAGTPNYAVDAAQRASRGSSAFRRLHAAGHEPDALSRRRRRCSRTPGRST